MMMQKVYARHKWLAYALACVLCAAALPLDTQAQRNSSQRLPPGEATTQERQRRVAVPPQQQTPTTTPTSSPTPLASPTQTIGVTPTPSTTSAGTLITLEDLRARIRATLDQPQLASALAAVKIVSLDTGRTLFEENAGKFLNPASNMKLFTIAAALARLSPDYRIKTSVYAPARPDAAGIVRGDLRIYGRGDPTYASRFTGTDARAAIDDLASRIYAAGVRRVEGDLVADESYFAGSPLGRGWEWDDLQWYYGAEVSALSVGDNAIEFAVKPSAQIGELCVVTTDASTTPLVSMIWKKQDGGGGYQMFPYPTTAVSTAQREANAAETMNRASPQAAGVFPPPIAILNSATTTPRGTPRALRVFRPLDSDAIEVSGTLPQGDNGFSGSVAVAHPAQLFLFMLHQSLTRRGITLAGATRVVSRDDVNYPPGMALVEIASKQSPPLSVIARETMKPSQNLYTELLLRQLAAPLGNVEPATGVTAEAGLESLNSFLRAVGVTEQDVVTADGSGLSRGNFVTAAGVVKLLTYMDKHPYRLAFRDTLPVAGVDGTLRNRLKGTRAAGNVLAKTGTLSNATSLSGYVTSRVGERLVFSLIINNHPPDIEPRQLFADPLALALAEFGGRS